MLGSFIWAEESDKEKALEISYYQGKLESEFLPYGREFVIKGSTKMPKGKAVFVKLDINYKGSRQGGDTWDILTADSPDTFKLRINPLEFYDEPYDLTFKFYSSPAIDDHTINDIIQTTLKELTDLYFQNRHLSQQIAEKKLQDVIVEEIKVLNSKIDIGQGKLFRINVVKGKKSGLASQSEVPKFPLIGSTLMKYVAIQCLHSRDVKVYEEALTKLAEYSSSEEKRMYLDDLKGEIQALIEKTEKSKKAIIKARTEGYIVFKNALANPDSFDSKKVNQFFQGEVWPGELGNKIRGILMKVIAVSNAYKNLEESTNKIKDLVDIEGHNVFKEEIFTKFAATLQDYYVRENVVIINDEPTKSPVKVDKLYLSSGFGYAMCTLAGYEDIENSTKETQVDLFAYLTVKIYLGPVDKGLPRGLIYPCFRSRFSVMLGSVFKSKITYRGQEQKSAFAGIIPMVGLGYDINRFLGVSAGAIIFRQPNINPLAVSDKIKAQFFLGFNFDLDVFNLLKDWFGK